MNNEITSLQHPTVKHLVRLRQNRDYRYEHKTLVIEGIKTIQEVCSQYPPKVLLTYDVNLIPEGIKADKVHVVNEIIMQKTSGMIHPEGILAEVPMPTENPLSNMRYILALDNINDPGNLGTLLRTALALNWDAVFILGESCDPYNEKALRSARGATFRLPIRHGSWDQLKDLIGSNKLTPLVADLHGTPLDKAKTGKGVLLVLSNEAHGVSEEAARICEKISIPISGKMESLNVAAAGAILMYTLII